MVNVLENIERVLKNNSRKDKHARYVALDIVRQELRRLKGEAVSPKAAAATAAFAARRSSRSNYATAVQYDLSKLSSGSRRKIKDFMRTGQKIQAIKELRTALGLGLKEAKDTVEMHPDFAF
jgi:ribosomal protein L7/L12